MATASLIKSSKTDIYNRAQFFNAGLTLQHNLAKEAGEIQLGWVLVNTMSNKQAWEISSAQWFRIIKVLLPELNTKSKILQEILTSTPPGANRIKYGW